MQTTKLRPLFQLVSINKEVIRTVAVASTAVKTDTLKPWNAIPGPSSLPIIGQIHHFLPGGSFGDMKDPETISRLLETYGPVVRLDSMLGKPPLLFLSDPDSAELVDVIFAHREMSLMDKYYPNAKEYIPERWLTNKDDPLHYGNAHPFAYGPFGFGARSCIGRRIAELEMDTFVARLIENFQVEWFGPPPTVVQEALNYIKGPYNFVFKDIK